MPFAPLSVMDFHQCIGQLFLLSGGDEDAPCRGERLLDKSKNQWQEFWTASGRIYSVIPNPRHHALVFDSRSASRSTMNPTTCEPRYPMVRWQIANSRSNSTAIDSIQSLRADNGRLES